MKLTTGNVKVITTTDWHFDYFEVIKDVFAYRIETYSVRSNEKVHSFEMKTPEPTIIQGVCKRKGLTAIRKGNVPGAAQIHGLFVCADDLLSDIKRFGYSGVSSRNYKGMDNDSIYDFLLNGGSADNVIRFNGSDHSFWNLDGTLIPTGVYFDYIEPRFHNLCYDLPKAVAHLNTRDDVVFFDPENRSRRFGASISETVMTKGEVSSIPYYNNDGGRHAFLSFFWTPNQEQAEKLQKDRGNRYKLVFDEDMLGLRACGAALFDTFYGEIEVDRSDDDDD